MVLSEAQYSDAILEARRILKLGQKWQELMPGEKRPNFERAAREILKRAMSHQVERNEEPLDIRERPLIPSKYIASRLGVRAHRDHHLED